MTKSTYPLAAPTWGAEERAAIERVLDSGQLTMGQEVAELEREFAAFVGRRHAVMVNSGSSANLLAVAALSLRKGDRLQPGDEVLVPAVSWSTSYFPFTQHGMHLRFVDVNADTLTIDVEAARRAVTGRTRALLAVSLLGCPCDYRGLREFCLRHSLVLIEDCCEAMGATYEGHHVGAFGEIATFSTYFSHHISTVEGGFVVTDEEELCHILLSLRSHGWTRQLPVPNHLCEKSDDPFVESFRFVLPGYNVRPLELLAAVGREQLRKLNGFVSVRRANAEHFHGRAAELPQIRTQCPVPGASYFAFPILLSEAALPRNTVVAALAEAGVETRPVVAGNFVRQPVLAHLPHSLGGALPVADAWHERGFMLGNHSYDLRPELDAVFDTLGRVFGEA